MPYQTLLSGQVFTFDSVKEVLAKANEEKSGDVLAGMTAAFLGQKHLRKEHRKGDDRAELAADAVFYHGAAGDACAVSLGEYAMLPTDLIEAIPQVLRQWTER